MMGYLMIDDRASGGEMKEYNTVSCRHCQGIIKVVKGQRQGAWCMNCSGPVHDRPGCASRCTPFFKKIEEKLARQRFLTQIGVGG